MQLISVKSSNGVDQNKQHLEEAESLARLVWIRETHILNVANVDGESVAGFNLIRGEGFVMSMLKTVKVKQKALVPKNS